MIWIVYIAGGLVGLVVLMALIGLAIPKGHVAARRAVYAKSPDEVWRAVTDLDAHTRWRKGVRKIERLSATSFREHSRQGAITFSIDEDRAPAPGNGGRRVTRIADDKLPFGGRWIFELQPDGAGSRLTITEDGFIKNPVFRFMSKTVFSTTATLEHFLSDLAAHLGVATTVEPAPPGN
jgi:hypothetical protein